MRARIRPQPHSHGTHHEIFYVVRGGVTGFLDDVSGKRHVRELGPGDFGYVPAGILHAYRVEVDETRVLGVSSAGFERFFQTLGEPTTADHYPATPLGLPPAGTVRGGGTPLRHAVPSGPAAGPVTTPAPPGLTRPDTDPLPDPVPLEGDIGWVRRAVEYSAPVGYRPLQLDLYTPDGTDSATPVVLFVHGGGWRLGTRRVFCPTWRDWDPDPFHRLVAAGFAVASIDYRLSGEAVFPAQLHDAQTALQWLGIRADELGVDANRVVAWGESAGAHLAALLGLTTGSAVIGVVDWYGPADLGTMQYQASPNAVAQLDAPDSRESLLIGAPLLEAPQLVRDASPVSYVRAGAPPFHIAHGTADRLVPAAQSEQFAEALRTVGIDVELTLVPEADHMWMGAGDPEAIFNAAVGFARRITES